MPPRTAEEITARRINNLIGLFAVSVIFFLLVYLLGRSTPSSATPALLWFFGLMGGASLAGWWGLSALRLQKSVESKR